MVINNDLIMIIRKRLPDYELKYTESIASEITINKDKWYLLSFYRTERKENPKENIRKFFEDLYSILCKVTNMYDNIMLMGDINIDHHDISSTDFNDLQHFNDIFGLKNLIKMKACFFKDDE